VVYVLNEAFGEFFVAATKMSLAAETAHFVEEMKGVLKTLKGHGAHLMLSALAEHDPAKEKEQDRWLARETKAMRPEEVRARLATLLAPVRWSGLRQRFAGGSYDFETLVECATGDGPEPAHGFFVPARVCVTHPPQPCEDVIPLAEYAKERGLALRASYADAERVMGVWVEEKDVTITFPQQVPFFNKGETDEYAFTVDPPRKCLPLEEDAWILQELLFTL
jgi:hypothetical protein